MLKSEQTIIHTNIEIIKVVVDFDDAPDDTIFAIKLGENFEKYLNLKSTSAKLINISDTNVKTIEIAMAAPELFTIKLIKVVIEANAQSAIIAIPVDFISSTKSFDFIEVLENNINTINPTITEQTIKRIAKAKFQINFESTISSLLIPLEAIFLIVPVLKSFPTNIQGIIKNTKVTGLAIDLYCSN